ncbi:MAG: molybdopterin molybdenumtransferase MoeA [Gammaproteobacteria bacterium]|nr:molybdopterin molybdenumtransferase MoeA [Gammaproteobacteria bacterium]
MSDDALVKDFSCMDDYDPNSLPADVALETIKSSLSVIKGTEKVALRTALNAVLDEDIFSRINVPSGINSAMDGYAISSKDIPGDGIRELKVIGTSWAGKPFKQGNGTGECTRIMTGGILPEGTDTVVIQESVERTGDTIRVDSEIRSGDNVRQAGEDISVGDKVLNRGIRLTAADLGLLASLGIGEVKTKRKLRVAFFSTGDELRSIGEALDEGSVYDSNRYTLYGMLNRLGCDILDMGVIRDDREAVKEAFLSASDIADVVISSGGVSVGEADFVKETLDELGKVEFWKVAMKPGRPLAFGRVKNACFFGLPGNPVSVMVTFYQFVQPALRTLMGETQTEVITMKVPCVSKLKKRPGRLEYQRGIMERNDEGLLVVRKTSAQGSGILSSMSRANCFIILPIESSTVEPGMNVDVQPFFGLV